MDKPTCTLCGGTVNRKWAETPTGPAHWQCVNVMKNPEKHLKQLRASGPKSSPPRSSS